MNDQRQGTTKIDVPGAKLAPAAALRLDRLGRELRLTNQILAPDLDAVSIVENGPAPAWTTLEGDHITFALGSMPFPTGRLDVAVWMGTNAHELGHVLFSPRRGSTLMVRVAEGEAMHLRGISGLWNIVEDQRQERLVLARFAPWRAYLTAALGYHLRADTDAAWLLFTGRTWLPDAVRAAARERFAKVYGAASADTVAEIVGDFQRLADPGEADADEAWTLLLRLHDVFGTNVPASPCRCGPLEAGEPDTSPEPAQGAPAAAGEVECTSGDGDEVGEPSDDGEPEAAKASTRQQITEAAAAEISADAGDLDSILDALAAGRAGDGVEGAARDGHNVPASDRARRLHREVSDALMDLHDTNEPGWLKRVDSGRLNVRRLADPWADPDQLFDRYAPGQMDANEIELVLLLDASGSMSSSMVALAEATWAIRQAVDDLEGTATVIAWDNGPHRIVAGPGERPDDRMFVPRALGGTVPTSALSEAYRLISDSNARNRLVVILTDGDWHEPAKAERLIGAIGEAGALTVCALLGKTVSTDSHGCRHAARIDNPSELARLFRDIAAAQIGAA